MPNFKLKKITLKRKAPVNVANTWSSRQANRFSLWQLLTFALISAGIGGYLIYHSYAVVVCACGGGGPIPPTTPTSLIANPVSSSEIDFSWGASTSTIGLAGYNIYEVASPGEPVDQQVGQTNNPITTTFMLTGLGSDTTYGFYVEARDTQGNLSAASNRVTATTPVDPPPSPTADISSRVSPITSGSKPTLIYSANDATSCGINGKAVNLADGENSYTAPAITADTTYALSCSGPGGTVKASTIVAVDAQDSAISNTSDQSGQSTNDNSAQPDYVPQDGTAPQDNTAPTDTQPTNPAAQQPAHVEALQPSHAKRSSPLKWLSVILIVVVAAYLLVGSGVFGNSFRLPPFKKKTAVVVAPPVSQNQDAQTAQKNFTNHL